MRRKRLANANRADFLLVVEDACPSNSARRAIADGQVEVLGLFARPEPCWIVQVERRGGVAYFYVQENRAGQVTVHWFDSLPPWSLWAGDEFPDSPINQGDNPEQYAAWRRQAQQHGGHRE